MPLGIVSEEDFLAEIERSNGIKRNVEIIEDKSGRGSGNVEVPDSLRKIIGEEKIEGANNQELARAFGISESSASAYAVGATSTASYDKPNKELKRHVDTKRVRLLNKAHNRLSYALNGITPEKLEVAKLTEASAVARDMSAIIKNLEPKEEDSQRDTNVQFNFFVPRMRQETEFEAMPVIDLE